MAFYQAFPYTRTPATSLIALNLALRAVDPTAGLSQIVNGVATVKSNAAWTPARVAAAQGLLDTTGEPTAQVVAQRTVDSFPIEVRALVLVLIDQINILRAALPVPLGPVTPAQAIAAIRAKAGTLS